MENLLRQNFWRKKLRVAIYDSLVEGEDSAVEIHILLGGDYENAADMVECEKKWRDVQAMIWWDWCWKWWKLDDQHGGKFSTDTGGSKLCSPAASSLSRLTKVPLTLNIVGHEMMQLWTMDEDEESKNTLLGKISEGCNYCHFRPVCIIAAPTASLMQVFFGHTSTTDDQRCV